jgi:hypothetical protein
MTYLANLSTTLSVILCVVLGEEDPNKKGIDEWDDEVTNFIRTFRGDTNIDLGRLCGM